MSDEKQAPRPEDGSGPAPDTDSEPAPGAESDPASVPAPHPVFEYLEPGSFAGGPPSPIEPGLERRGPPPGFLPWLWILTLIGIGALLTGQTEAALLVGVAGLFVTAQGADAQRGWRWIHALVVWVVPVGGAVFLAALAAMLYHGELPLALRLGAAALAGAGGLLCLASLLRPVADGIGALLFPGQPSSHTLRLAARLALACLLLAFPTWLALRGELSSVLEDPGTLVSARTLSGSLVGYVVLAFASVGWLVRRPLRDSLARLGIKRLGPRDIAVVAAGIAALWFFNSGSEWLQRACFPELWKSDQSFTESLAHVMGSGQMVLLGLSAGIGEEITMRGALQPRLGLVRTSLLFAALHVQYSWYGIASIFLFGLILGLIRRRSGTSAAIAVHALFDMLVVATAGT
jgi:hypothetical protein